MSDRGLKSGDWQDRKEWRLKTGSNIFCLDCEILYNDFLIVGNFKCVPSRHLLLFYRFSGRTFHRTKKVFPKMFCLQYTVHSSFRYIIMQILLHTKKVPSVACKLYLKLQVFAFLCNFSAAIFS